MRRKGNYKQELMPKYRQPNTVAKKRAEDWLYSYRIIRIFVDASALQVKGLFGLGMCVVGQGTTIVKSKKHYNLTVLKSNVYAELLAVDFCLEMIDEITNELLFSPSEICIFSDCDPVVELINGTQASQKPDMNSIIEQIKEKEIKFFEKYPLLELRIHAMDKELKRYNPYHVAAHNAARNVIGLKG